jgi:type II restriction enzyme
MSGSDKLRETIAENPIANINSQKIEKNVIAATKRAINKLKLKYPKLKITCDNSLSKLDIHTKLKKHFTHPDIGTNISVLTSGIRPDGGLIYVSTNSGIKLLLGVVEAKKQGTNDIRVLEGKNKQAKGNAIERSAKNYVELTNYFLNEDIFPYLMFMNGCDVEDINSSIRDRITNMNLGSPFNDLYVSKIADKNGRLHHRTSIFIGFNDIDLMAEKVFEMLDISMKYYINKYAMEFNNVGE